MFYASERPLQAGFIGDAVNSFYFVDYASAKEEVMECPVFIEIVTY